MSLHLLVAVSIAALLFTPSTESVAQHTNHAHHQMQAHNHSAALTSPASVMGDHIHEKGRGMLAYRYMQMTMRGNRIGTQSFDPATIATTIVNPNAGSPTLRVVPTDMTMDMHMIGAMYAPSDWLTLMVMGQWLDKEMEHVTFAGVTGTTELGMFTTNSSGWGDTKLSALLRVYDNNTHHIHANLGVRLPTGSITERDNVLAPTGARPDLRLPYAMQLGTGTFDALPGVTYTGSQDQLFWGAQYMAEIPLESENDEGYSWGDRHQVTVWGAYQWRDNLSTSLRFTGWTQDDIDGSDSEIAAPVQTADPDSYGGNGLDIGLGVNYTPQSKRFEGHNFSAEAAFPIRRDLNGPQLETDVTISASWKYSF